MVDVALVGSSDLVGFPGAPFSDGVAAAAGGQVRALCGWHVAPQVTETLVVETGGSVVVLLPSLRVASVAEVRDGDGNVLGGWRVRPNGVLRRDAGWPDVIEVDLTHGYDKCPAELIAVVAEFARSIKAGGVKAESLAGRSVQLDTTPGGVSADILARYSIPERP